MHNLDTLEPSPASLKGLLVKLPPVTLAACPHKRPLRSEIAVCRLWFKNTVASRDMSHAIRVKDRIEMWCRANGVIAPHVYLNSISTAALLIAAQLEGVPFVCLTTTHPGCDETHYMLAC